MQTYAEQRVQSGHLVLEGLVRCLLQLGPHVATSRVEHVANVVEAAEDEGSFHEWLERLEQSGGAARLDEQTRLVDEQRALAEHVGVEVARARAAEYLAVDHVENGVDAVARYEPQVIALLGRFGVAASEPDLEQFLGAFEEFHLVCLFGCLLNNFLDDFRCSMMFYLRARDTIRQLFILVLYAFDIIATCAELTTHI
jgi:hypothetical protein